MKRASLAVVLMFLIPALFSSCGGGGGPALTGTWSDISVKDDQIKLITLGRKTPGTLYAFSEKKFYVSKDSGASWGLKENINFDPNTVLKAETDNLGFLYLLLKVNESLEGALVKTNDEGVTLISVADPKTLPLPAKKGGRGGISCFKVHPKQPENIILAGFQYASVLLTKNGGKDWKLLSTGVEGRKNFSFAEFDRDNPEIMYFEEGEGPLSEGDDRSSIYGSKDGGNSWNLLFDKKRGEGRVSGAAAVPDAGALIFAFRLRGGDFPEIIKTLPLTWENGKYLSLPVKDFSGRITDLFAEKDGSVYANFVDEKSRVMRSTGGEKWADMQAPITMGKECVLQLTMDPENPEELYALTQDYTTNATRILMFKK